MRVLLVGLVVASACYAPTVPAGVTCDPQAPHCPTGQACIAAPGGAVCTNGSGSATDDAPIGPPGDRDGDGVPDGRDNCPDVANPDQHDEDNDGIGDACDGCPPISDPSQPDADGDHVDDACDPHPHTAGDRIELFESFRNGVPSSWTVTGTWTPVADGVSTTVMAGGGASLSPPFVPSANGTVSAGIIPNALSGNLQGIGVVSPASADFTKGAACLLFLPAGTTEHHEGLVDLTTTGVLTSQAYSWSLGLPYILMEQRAGTLSTCTVVALGGGRVGIGTTVAATPASPRIAVGTSSISGQVLWLMYVSSP